MTFITVTVDTEEEWEWDTGYSDATGGLSNITEGLLPFHSLCREYGLKVTYFTNYSVLRDHHASKIIQSLSEDPQAEIGFHIHPWNTPPFDERQPNYPFHSYLHNLESELAIAKLQTIFRTFRQQGIYPTSYRGGRYSTNRFIQEFLADQGVIADASILPFTAWRDSGAPDFRCRDLIPYRVQLSQPNKYIWEIPLTLSFTRAPEWFWRRFYDFASRDPWRFFRLVGICERLICKRIWLNLENPLCDDLPLLLKRLRLRRIPHLNFTLHSSSLVVGKSPYTKSEQDLSRLRQRLIDSIQTLSEWTEYQPATVSEVAQHLENTYDASIRHKSS